MHLAKRLLCHVGVALLPILSAGNPPALTLQISTETVPAGGFAQIKVSLAQPLPLSTGGFLLDLDRTVFGDIASVSILSATGGSYGVAYVSGSHASVEFHSGSGGLGRLPDLPIITVLVPVRSDAAPGATTAITINPSDVTWKDNLDVAYAVTVNPGKITVGGELSIENVTPCGLLPAGTNIEILGTGFKSSTTVDIAGVSLSTVNITSPQRIVATLGAPAEVTGKRIRLVNPDRSQVDYFASLRGPVDDAGVSPGSRTVPLFPMQTYASASVGFSIRGGVVALQNQNISPVAISLAETGFSPMIKSVTIPSGGTYVRHASGPISIGIDPSMPIRMLQLVQGFYIPYPSLVHGTSIPNTTPPPPGASLVVSPQSLAFDWQIGSSAPLPAPVSLYSVPTSPPFNFEASASTSAGGPWLDVTPKQGTIPRSITVKVSPSGLGAGVYPGMITLTANGKTTVIPVSLTVSASPFITVNPSSLSFPVAPGTNPEPKTIVVRTTGTSAPISVTSSSTSGENWLSVNLLTGATPAVITAVANPIGLPAGDYRGSIVVHGPANDVTVPVQLYIAAQPPWVQLSDTALSFSAQQEGDPSTLFLHDVYASNLMTDFTVSVSSDSKWLKAAKMFTPAGVSHYYIEVRPDPSGLEPGTYHGTITLTSSIATNPPVDIPVTLQILTSSPPPLSVYPASLSFVDSVGNPYISSFTQELRVETGGIPTMLYGSQSTAGSASWMIVTGFSATTPATMQVGVYSSYVLPGEHHGSITISARSGTAIVPVTFRLTSDETSPPFTGTIVNAASQLTGPIAPGEIIAMHGTGVGPAFPATAISGSATELNGTRVLFDGISAPLIYASLSQVNAVVPPELAGHTATNVQIEFNGLRTVA